MAFDPSTATLAENAFDPETAKPLEEPAAAPVAPQRPLSAESMLQRDIAVLSMPQTNVRPGYLTGVAPSAPAPSFQQDIASLAMPQTTVRPAYLTGEPIPGTVSAGVSSATGELVKGAVSPMGAGIVAAHALPPLGLAVDALLVGGILQQAYKHLANFRETGNREELGRGSALLLAAGAPLVKKGYGVARETVRSLRELNEPLPERGVFAALPDGTILQRPVTRPTPGSELTEADIDRLFLKPEQAREAAEVAAFDASTARPVSETAPPAPKTEPATVGGTGTVPVRTSEPTATAPAESAPAAPAKVEAPAAAPPTETKPTAIPVETPAKTEPAPKPTVAEPGPGLTGGPGAAAAVEVAPGAGEDIFGIAASVRDEMVKTGRFPYVPPGQGTNAWEVIQRGRKLMREGADPDALLRQFEADKRVSADDLAVLRAHMENLYQQARRVEERSGTQSPEWVAAQGKLLDFWTRTKPMQTEWHKIGMAQQGMTDIDTGSLIGMEREHVRTTGNPFTPPQRAQAETLANAVATTTTEAGKAQQLVLDGIDKVVEQTATTPVKPARGKRKAAGETKPATTKPPATLDEARTMFADWKGEPLTGDQIRALWSHAKREYIGKSEANLDAIAQGVADDFGLPKRTVLEALASNKSVRRLTNDMYVKLARQRQAQGAARAWLLEQKYPGWLRIARKVPRAFFTARTFGHGTVGMVTHVGVLMFDPLVAREYWTNFGRQYRLAYSHGYHEAMMQDLMHRPNWVTAKRAGLANDPFRYVDDYQGQQLLAKGFKWFVSAGQRGFDALKLVRQDLFDRSWNALDATQRTPEMAQVIADNVNHSTGYVKANLGALQEPANVAFFAPRLEASRWAFAFGDPARALYYGLQWRESTPAQRMFAMQQLTQKARVVGTYMSLLAANNALLAASGSSDRVNFTEPKRGDFLAFKFAGHTVKVVGPMIRMLAFIKDMAQVAVAHRSRFEQLESRQREMAGDTSQYLRGKLSPFGAFVADQATQSSFEERPMPWSGDRPKPSLRRRNIGKFGWGEYALEQLAPIPVEEAIREVWKQQGIKWDVEGERWLRGIAAGVFTGGTGIRFQEETPAQKQPTR